MHVRSHKTRSFGSTTKPFARSKAFLVVSVVSGGPGRAQGLCVPIRFDVTSSCFLKISGFQHCSSPKWLYLSEGWAKASHYSLKKILGGGVYFPGLIRFFFYLTLPFPFLSEMTVLKRLCSMYLCTLAAKPVLGGWAGGRLLMQYLPQN